MEHEHDFDQNLYGQNNKFEKILTIELKQTNKKKQNFNFIIANKNQIRGLFFSRALSILPRNPRA